MTITHHTMTPEITRDHAFPADLPTLVARGVVVHRGGRRLLDDVTVSLAAGELVAVVGASGAEEHPARLVGGPAPLASGSVDLVAPGSGPTGSPYLPADVAADVANTVVVGSARSTGRLRCFSDLSGAHRIPAPPTKTELPQDQDRARQHN